MNFSRISIFVVLTVVVVYFGLSLIFPHRKIEPKMIGGPTPDAVFGSSTSAASSAAGRAPAAASNASAEAPTPASPNDAQSGDSGGDKNLTEAEARKIAEDVGRKVATQVTQQLLQQQAAGKTPTEAAPAVSDEDVRRIAQSEVHKAVEDQPAAADATTAAEPAPTAKAKKAASKKAEKTAVAKTEHLATKAPAASAKPSKHDEPQSEPNTAWWAPANGASSGLGLSFAGEAAAQRAIALLFNSPLADAADAGSHITVTNAAGKLEKGAWSLSQNPRMLILRVPTPGRYNVKVGADVADSQGKKLGTAVQGPVFVH